MQVTRRSFNQSHSLILICYMNKNTLYEMIASGRRDGDWLLVSANSCSVHVGIHPTGRKFLALNERERTRR